MVKCYLNKIKAISTACTIKPRPIVMMFSRSLSTTARKNIRTNPAQANSTMSKLGVRSESPVIKASKVGMVAA